MDMRTPTPRVASYAPSACPTLRARALFLPLGSTAEHAAGVYALEQVRGH